MSARSRGHDTSRPTQDDIAVQLPMPPRTQEEVDERLAELLPPDLSAHAIKNHLDKYVVGQESAKISFSVLLSMHLRWFNTRSRLHQAPNAILIGPTGVGKTHSLKTAAEYLKLPFAIVDATSLVPSGIAGQQVEDILDALVVAAESILAAMTLPSSPRSAIGLAERGIIFLDEFDKIRAAETAQSGTSTALSRLTQRRLLKLIEGSNMPLGLPHSVRSQLAGFSIDTSGILFVASGAFMGLDSQRVRSQRPGTLERAMKLNSQPITQDFVTYGFIPELVARLPILINYRTLTARDLHTILANPEVSPLTVWENHFRQFGKHLKVAADARVEVAKRAALLNMGARGLQQVLFPILADIAFDFEGSPDTAYELSLAAVQEDESPRNGSQRNSRGTVLACADPSGSEARPHD